MKKFLYLMLLAAVSSLNLWADDCPPDDPAHIATELNESNPPLRLGYCNTAFNPYYTKRLYEQTDQPHEFGGAIYYGPDQLSKYRDAVIRSVHFALWDCVGEHYTVFVTRELGETPIAYATVTKGNFHTGWNAVDIPPVKITGDEGLYIGWTGAVNQDEAMQGYITFDNTQGQWEPRTNYNMDAQGRWYAVNSQIKLNLMIRAYADGNNLPTGDVAMSNLDGPDVIYQSRATVFNSTITNYGLDKVNKLEVEIFSDGEKFDTKIVENLDLAHNERTKLIMSGIKYPDAGNHSITARVTKVNDEYDSDPRDNQQSMNLYAIPMGAKTYPRTLLFEEMTSEAEPSSPKADFIYNAGVQAFREMDPFNNKVIWVKHHIDVGTRKDGKTPYDTFGSKEDHEYISLYEGYPRPGCDFLPAVAIDRNIFNGMPELAGCVYFVTDELALQGLFAIAQQAPTYMEVVPTIDYNAETRNLSIDVTANASLDEMIHQTDLRLTVYVVEDGLTTTIQRFDNSSKEFMNEDGTFTQNGVIRAFPASVWGDKVELKDGTFNRHYDVTLDPSWNDRKIRVIAFAHNYDENTQTGNNTVYNAGEVLIDGYQTGVSSVLAPAMGGGKIFDLQGRPVTAPSHGVYIVDGRRVIL